MLRFGVVGLLNTLLGYGVILVLLALDWGDVWSNLSGYAAGLILGFCLNSQWTFRKTKSLRAGIVGRYAIVFLVAYSANLTVVLAARSMGLLENPLVHLVGICVYTTIFYFGSAYYVFVPDDISPDAA
ncbi:hypothetical protein BLM14_29280 (plasmid) [Phyllobacterium zundukense]|uniref:GtrA family protein n=1 Tax=Phyllobacterium zundukense TaxID=1867719 RepID=UPI000C1C75DE|nr:GtrA family protein [Phyllobacterium zundukense]ATU95831.1 hypothetical protein BLM14_29280 [Phyllobacterium zundukense]